MVAQREKARAHSLAFAILEFGSAYGSNGMGLSGGLYEGWVVAQEERLCFRATNRVVRDFEWGLEWARDWPCARECPKNGDTPADYIAKLNRLAVADSDQFFDYDRPSDFSLTRNILRFFSP